ncbi:MAG: class I SAM-dependent methyltransferase [Alphaproteobacteria bacterium]|nr:class I SAM-dependent methyltransferase [Alphaproteobacteria bacterium]
METLNNGSAGMADIDALKSKPWQSMELPADAAILEPKGMVGPKERACYYWLGRNWLTDRGHIVDAGCFVGASTHCFAAGAADGGRRDLNGERLVHAFDYFKVVDKYVGEAITRDFRPIGEGESYLDVFETQTKPYADMIKTYSGDFLAHRWHGAPIEILFIDIAKTAALNAHACCEFLPHLIPGHSVIIQQDYYHCWHPYIHISMEFLDDELELVDDHVPHQSAVWRLTKPIPQEKIDRLAAYDLTKEERLSLLDRIIAKASPTIKPMIEVVKAWQLCLDGDWEEAEQAHRKLRHARDVEMMQALWAKQALEVAAHIKRQKSRLNDIT